MHIIIFVVIGKEYRRTLFIFKIYTPNLMKKKHNQQKKRRDF